MVVSCLESLQHALAFGDDQSITKSTFSPEKA